ncbi:MAG: hypothetical protein SF097_19150, partial [Acidobacteriota bacterium]|nr:hypothetical protein [Acidobacteriota bacterium]
LFPALKWRLTGVSSVALSGLGGLSPLFPGVPKTPPPANIRCASGAKKKDVGNDKFFKLSRLAFGLGQFGKLSHALLSV